MQINKAVHQLLRREAKDTLDIVVQLLSHVLWSISLTTNWTTIMFEVPTQPFDPSHCVPVSVLHKPDSENHVLIL